MISNVVYELLDTLADKHIPQGKHKLLHVYSREVWVEYMSDLLDKKAITARLSTLKKCAIHWETLLVHKISSQN